MTANDCMNKFLEFASTRNVDEITVALRILEDILDSSGEYSAVSKLRQDAQQAIDVLQRFEKATTIRCEVGFILCFLNHFLLRKS